MKKLLTNKKGICIGIAAAIFLLVTVIVISVMNNSEGAPFYAELTYEKNTVRIYPVLNQNDYYLFLPSGTKKDDVQIKPLCSAHIDGIYAKKMGAAFISEQDHLLETRKLFQKNMQYPLHVIVSENIPALFIQTENSLEMVHADKNFKTPGTVLYEDKGELRFCSELTYLKGRGLSTWTAETEKKPYNIKFKEPVTFRGISAGKKYSLLANYYDASLLKNAAAYCFSKKTGLCTMDYAFVDLYINGDYRGNYLLCESVGVDKQRVDILNLEEKNREANPGLDFNSLEIKMITEDGKNKYFVQLPKNPKDFSGGYLLEYDKNEPDQVTSCGFSSLFNLFVSMKEPSVLSLPEIEYISDYVWQAEEAILDEDGYNSEKHYYLDYYDLESLTEDYIINEWFENMDCGNSSTFFYLDANSSKIKFGPVWDFDHSVVRSDKLSQMFFHGIERKWWVNNTVLNGPTIFSAAFMHKDFRNSVGKKWKQLRKTVFSDEQITSVLEDLRNTIQQSACMDICRWSSVTDKEQIQKEYQHNVEETTAGLIDRANLLDLGFSEKSAFLYYYVDEKIYRIDETIAQINSKVTVQDVAGGTAVWNTSPQLDGADYYVGGSILLTDPVTKLYLKTVTEEN